MTTLAPPPPAEAVQERRSRQSSGYRPDIDGLRTVAVYSVLLFHAGVRTFSGGFIGVDVFFVLSGFLITRLLMVELTGTGRLDAFGFYARRMRRLLPASWVTLVLGSIAAATYLPPLQLEDLTSSARSGFLWFANWHFISVGNDYFHAEDGANPFLHYWSLSLEEQFYVIWPALLLLAAWLVVRSRVRIVPAGVVLVGAVLGAIASAAWAVHLAGTDPVHAYYGTEARAYQLLAGAALATVFVQGGVPQGRRARAFAGWSQLLGLVGIVLLCSRLIGVGVAWRGILATVATLCVLAGIEVHRGGAGSRFLGTEWMARLGRVSYGTYLWHWVVIVILLELTDWWPVVTAVVTAVVATGLAAISAVVVERPVRSSRWLGARPRTTVLLGVSISVALALALPAVVRVGAPVLASSTGTTVKQATLDWQAAKIDGGKAPSCYRKPVVSCRVVDSGPNAPVVVLMGDSHARSTLRAFSAIARDRRWTLYATIGSGCPWQWGMLYPRSWGAQTDACVDLQNDWFRRVVPAIHPRMTFLVSYSFDDPTGPEDMRSALASEAKLDDATLADRSVHRSLSALRSAGSRVTIVEPFPISYTGNPLACLSEGKPPASCDFTATLKPIPAEARYRAAAAADDGIVTLDLDRVVCPDFPHCAEVIDGFITHRDHDHVTSTFLLHERRAIEQAIDRAHANP